MNADKLSYEQKFVGLSLLKTTNFNHAALVFAEAFGFSLSYAKDIVFDLNARFRICSYGVIERSGDQFFIYEESMGYKRTLIDYAYISSVGDVSFAKVRNLLTTMNYLREVQTTNAA